MHGSASARALAAAGYEVRSRVLVECLVVCGPEQVIGRGATEDAALEDAVAQLLPSRLGRTLFAEAIAALSPANSVEAATAAPPTADAAALDESAEPVEAAAPAVVPAPPEPPAEPLPAEAVEEMSVPLAPPSVVSASPPEAAAEPVQTRTAPRAPPRRVRPEDVDRLAAPFHDEAVLRAFARLAPERQRRRMLKVICDARALEELAPDDREVELAVARVARRLTEIGKMFWPGSVRALASTVCPDDVRLEWRVASAAHLRTWQQAAAFAERLLAEELARPALDADGWADHAECTPRPQHPDAVLAEAEATLRKVLGDGEQPRRASELAPADLAHLGQATSRLRWVRGAVSDDIAWCKALGRVRRAGTAQGVLGERLQGALDPRTRPPMAWVKVLTPAEDPADKSRAEREKLTAALPAAVAAADTLMAWLLRAFEVSVPTPQLVEMLVAHKGTVLALAEQHKDHESRSVRSKLRKLAQGLAPEVAAPAAPPADTAAPEDPAHALDPVVARVRPQTEGQRVLFVSNREDPELGAVLTELLGVASIVWCDGSLRRVQAQCERIGKGTYDLVLSATGFQVHGVDTALQRASSAAKVRYVRVNKGRPVACVQAIARELGLGACAPRPKRSDTDLAAARMGARPVRDELRAHASGPTASASSGWNVRSAAAAVGGGGTSLPGHQCAGRALVQSAWRRRKSVGRFGRHASRRTMNCRPCTRIWAGTRMNAWRNVRKSMRSMRSCSA